MSRKTVAQHGRRYRQQLPKVDPTLEGIELPPPLVKIVQDRQPSASGARLQREVSKLHTALHDCHLLTDRARGWFEPERYDTTDQLQRLTHNGYLEYREILQPGGFQGCNRYCKQYRITPAGSRLLGLDHPTIQEDTPMDTPVTREKSFKPGDKALFEGNQVRINTHPTTNHKISIELLDSEGRPVNRYVDVDELTRIPASYQDVPHEIINLVRSLHEDEHVNMSLAAMLYRELKSIHGCAQIYDQGWQLITNRRAVLDNCRLLAQAGLVEMADDTGTQARVRITRAGSDALGWDHPVILEEDRIPVVEKPASTPAVNTAAESAPSWKIEVKTLYQILSHPEKISAADHELAKYLSAGWVVLHFQVSMATSDTTSARMVTLQRIAKDEPAPLPEPAAAVATKPDPAPVTEEPQPEPRQEMVQQKLVEPVGEPVMILPGSPLPLSLGPWGRAIRDHGLEEALSVADQRVVDVFTRIYQESLDRNQIAVRPLLPTQSS